MEKIGDEIRKYLRKGYRKRIADKLGVSRSLVGHVVSGISFNIDIYEEIISEAETEKIRLASLKQREQALYE